MKIFLITMQRVLFAVGRGIVEIALGGWDSLLFALVLFIVIEYLTQILVAFLNKKIFSEIGSSAIIKKVYIFFMVAVGNMIDTLIMQNGSMVRTAVIFFYLSNEGITILENAATLGLPIPQILKDILKQLKEGKNDSR
jgi:toxin secretion/phage lysis holin